MADEKGNCHNDDHPENEVTASEYSDSAVRGSLSGGLSISPKISDHLNLIPPLGHLVNLSVCQI